MRCRCITCQGLSAQEAGVGAVGALHGSMAVKTRSKSGQLRGSVVRSVREMFMCMCQRRKGFAACCGWCASANRGKFWGVAVCCAYNTWQCMHVLARSRLQKHRKLAVWCTAPLNGRWDAPTTVRYHRQQMAAEPTQKKLSVFLNNVLDQAGAPRKGTQSSRRFKNLPAYHEILA